MCINKLLSALKLQKQVLDVSFVVKGIDSANEFEILRVPVMSIMIYAITWESKTYLLYSSQKFLDYNINYKKALSVALKIRSATTVISIKCGDWFKM